jgi:hypothetical protein
LFADACRLPSGVRAEIPQVFARKERALQRRALAVHGQQVARVASVVQSQQQNRLGGVIAQAGTPRSAGHVVKLHGGEVLLTVIAARELHIGEDDCAGAQVHAVTQGFSRKDDQARLLYPQLLLDQSPYALVQRAVMDETTVARPLGKLLVTDTQIPP